MTEHQRSILKLMAVDDVGRVSAGVFSALCGSAKTVRAMFRDGLVVGDGIPATYVEVTERAREQLRAE